MPLQLLLLFALKQAVTLQNTTASAVKTEHT
jgi:hypothetical protein